MRKTIIFISILFALLSSATQSACVTSAPNIQPREFYLSQPTVTTFAYKDKRDFDFSAARGRMMGIATDAETKLKVTNELIRRSTLVGVNWPKHALSYKEEFIKQGKALFTCDVERDLDFCKISSVIINGKYRSEYVYIPNRNALPTIKTTDIASGKIVSETRNVEIVGDGTFRVEETNYKDGTEVFKSTVRRDISNGLIVEESIKSGALDYDYHHYELLLGNWSGCEIHYPR